MATATPSYARSLASCVKRSKLSPSTASHTRAVQTSSRRGASPVTTTPNTAAIPPSLETELASLRLPKAVQATYLDPLRRQPTHGIEVCDLQLRSYSVRNLEVFVDFALRAAYYLNLPAKGPRSLPRVTERWTVPRSNFVHKKSQENFERITMRRGIRILDGHPETVAIWLAYLQKHQYYGVGMKANVFDHSGLKVSEDMDVEANKIGKFLGRQKLPEGTHQMLKSPRAMLKEPFKAQWGAFAAMGGAPSVRSTRVRVPFEEVVPPEIQAERYAKAKQKESEEDGREKEKEDA